MCVEARGRIRYARALIEVCANKELKQEVIMAVPNVDDEGASHTLEKIRVEYEWKPPLCLDCHVFGHANEQCPKRVQEKPSPAVEIDDDGFTRVVNRKSKGSSPTSQKQNFVGVRIHNPKTNLIYQPVKTTTKDPKPGATKTTNEEQDNGIKLKNLFEKLNEITVPVTGEASGGNDMEDILGGTTKDNHDDVLGTRDPFHVKTNYLNEAAKADLEDALNDDDEEVDEVYIEVNNRLIKQTKGASTLSDRVQDV
ncbi:trichome birefringence-like protein 3 [Tanacetum coccineum]